MSDASEAYLPHVALEPHGFDTREASVRCQPSWILTPFGLLRNDLEWPHKVPAEVLNAWATPLVFVPKPGRCSRVHFESGHPSCYLWQMSYSASFALVPYPRVNRSYTAKILSLAFIVS